VDFHAGLRTRPLKTSICCKTMPARLDGVIILLHTCLFYRSGNACTLLEFDALLCKALL
jgi:hypothetical protein